MRLWLLRPQIIDGGADHPTWTPWYDKAFGFVVRAETEMDARNWASTQAGDEGGAAWLDASHSTCEELTSEGNVGVVMRDFAGA